RATKACRPRGAPSDIKRVGERVSQRKPTAAVPRRGTAVLVPELRLSVMPFWRDAGDEEALQVPGHSRARRDSLPRQCSGYAAWLADCRSLWQPRTAQERIPTFDPPPLTGMCPSPQITTRVQTCPKG